MQVRLLPEKKEKKGHVANLCSGDGDGNGVVGEAGRWSHPILQKSFPFILPLNPLCQKITVFGEFVEEGMAINNVCACRRM